MPSAISKSKYLAGLQCPKLLWTHYNDRDSIPPPGPDKQAIFDAGHVVGDLAKDLFPGGVEIDWSGGLEATMARTLELMQRRIPLYEASFLVDGCYCRADLLVPAGEDAWNLYEVKSSTRVKDVNLHDVAFQACAIERCGGKLDRLHLVHIDNSYVRQGAIDVHGLFHIEDVTERARQLQPDVLPRARRMHEVIAGERPDTPIGRHCFQPYPCDLWDRCAAHLPDRSVLDLYRIRKAQAFRWIDAGITGLADVPASQLTGPQRIQQQAVRSGQPQVQVREIRRWLDELEHPLYCLDFETMNPAIPLFYGSRPFEHIPFQFSLHVLENADTEPQHHEFLATKAVDPRAALADALVDALDGIGQGGTLLAFNASFERRVIRNLADDVPRHAEFLRGLDGRFEDLATPFSSFWYHDARQGGSCSLKAVLPALTDTSYLGMEIAAGGQAMREFERVVFGSVPAEEKERVLGALREYCAQDTLALVQVLRALDSAI